MGLLPPVVAVAVAYAAKIAMVATLPHNLASLMAGCVAYTIAYGGLIYAIFIRGEGLQRLKQIMFSRPTV
jgi:hypothetical protein